MVADIFLKLIREIWPMLFIFTIILVSIRITYLFYNKKQFILYKELLMLCFIMYVLLLYYIVTFQDNNYGVNNFVPFREIFRYNIKSKLFFKNVVGNVLLFVPFGLFVSYYVETKKIYPTLFLSILVSCSIEFAQSLIGRTADVDDVILNTIGGVTGYLLYYVGNKFTSKVPKIFKNQLFLDTVSLIAILVTIYLAFRFKFWRMIL